MDTMSPCFVSTMVMYIDAMSWDTARMSEAQPTLARRDLGIRLKGHRERVGLTPKQAALLIGYTDKTIGRIEAGTHGTRRPVVESLVKHYGIEQDEASHLLFLVARGAERGWWEDYIDKGTKEGTRPDFPMFLESEQIASLIQVFEAEVIPGLLQTPAYLRALQAAQLGIPADVAERVRRLRERRQQLFNGRRDSPQMHFLIGEAAMRYLFRLDPATKDGQIDRLRQVAAMRGVDIRVVTELHAAAAGSFAILTPPGAAAPIVYTDHLDGCRYIEDADVTSRYAAALAAAVEKTQPLEEYLHEHAMA